MFGVLEGDDAVAAARAALAATGLLRRPTGEWVVLEVRTDGMFNHVDRDVGLPELEREIQRHIAEAFWERFGEWRPWGATWHPRPSAAA